MNVDTEPDVGETIRLKLADLIPRPDWQFRTRLNAEKLALYAARMKNGEEPPPIDIAILDGVPHGPVDGNHRRAAARLASVDELPARVVAKTEDAARFLAFQANTEHGVPLGKRDIPKRLAYYVEKGMWRDGRGRPKTLRDVARDLGIGSHNTVSHWMRKNHRKAYNSITGRKTRYEQPAQTNQPSAAVMQARRAAGELVGAARALDPDEAATIVKELVGGPLAASLERAERLDLKRLLLKAIKSVGAWQPNQPDAEAKEYEL